ARIFSKVCKALRVCFRLLGVLLFYRQLFLVFLLLFFCLSSYIIEQGVCYLVLCEAAFPKKLAFAYLEDLHSEFDEQHGKKVPTVSRPYSFIEFDTYIQKTKKLYIDSRARRNLGSINTELQDVQRIMVANIEEVLQRGEALSGM
ncbi:vesicle-trafficking protein SEC22b-like, partial [Leptonychotes weddellii]|uniref:Vesicle-trafficking protein SEC22b-like n=1 Tax=Leptonychotes weddellii TaxID=9713 RepID=A0A7F8QDM1_LEPWE